jgi:hypothetical protein
MFTNIGSEAMPCIRDFILTEEEHPKLLAWKKVMADLQ